MPSFGLGNGIIGTRILTGQNPDNNKDYIIVLLHGTGTGAGAEAEARRSERDKKSIFQSSSRQPQNMCVCVCVRSDAG